ncbi:MAG TPA: glycosyltransferase family 4 protein [Burkholderiales bacterium]|nr:glycosyltransferase family 4 protein [Burkholderiales bacterium]
MRLLYVFPEPLPLERARGIQTVHTVAALAAQGIEVTLVHVPSTGDPFDAYSVAMPGKVRLLPVSRSLPWPFSRMHSNRVFAARLAKRIDPGEIGAVMARHLKASTLLLDRIPSLRLVYEAHEVFADTAPLRRRRKTERLERGVVRRAAALVANSKATAARLRALYDVTAPIEVIPNGVEYRESVPAKDWARASERIVYAGSFFSWKGVDDLADAARTLPGLRIRLIGGDEARIAELRARAGSVGAALDFTGRIPHGRVATELARACIAVLPNRADPDSAFTSPIKLFEYMAAGCAIVVSDLPALREVLDSGDAVWVAPGDAAGLADAIRALAEDPERARRLGARVREKARSYTWAARGERLARIVRPLLGTK